MSIDAYKAERRRRNMTREYYVSMPCLAGTYKTKCTIIEEYANGDVCVAYRAWEDWSLCTKVVARSSLQVA